MLFESDDLTVLYIEADVAIRRDSKKLFDSLFKEVITARDGEEGLHLYKEYYKKNNKYVDIVITEINIPKLHGNDMLEAIKEINAYQRVIVTSVQKDLTYILQSLKLGVDDYLLKPINKEKYLDALQKVISKVRFTQQNRDKQNYLNALINKKEEVLQQQEKMAQIGSLLESIAHQWKEPLNTIGVLVSGMDYYRSNGINIEDKDLANFIVTSKQQVEHLTETLDEFRTFYDNTKKFETFKITEVIDTVLLLLKDEFIKYKIDIKIHVYDDISITAVKNEFKHVILNLLNNSKDAFIRNNISDRRIDISVSVCADANVLQFNDTAGGIPNEHINDIFEKGISSKENKVGSGIGLNMVYKILEKYYCKVNVKNINNVIPSEAGTSFTIKVPL